VFLALAPDAPLLARSLMGNGSRYGRKGGSTADAMLLEQLRIRYRQWYGEKKFPTV
jgi:hypothetical protein